MPYIPIGLEYAPADDPSFVGLSVARASTAYYKDKLGVLQSVGNNVLRNSHYAPGGLRSTLMEPARTNHLVRSEDFSASWTLLFLTRTSGRPDPKGTNGATLLQAFPSGSQGEMQMNNITTLTDATPAIVSLFVKRGYHVPAQGSEIGLFDATAGVWRGSVLLQWSNDTPVLTARNGATGLKSERYKDGWWRIALVTTNVTAANSNRYVVQVNDQNLADPDADLIVFGAQLESGTAFPTSYIATAGATAVRTTDSVALSLPYPLTVPQAMTVYVKFTELGLAKLGSFIRLLQIGDATAGRKQINIRTNPSLQYDAVHEINGGGGVFSQPAVQVNDNDVVEIRVVITSDGAIQMAIAVNGGTETFGSQSGPFVLDPNWANATNGDVISFGGGPIAVHKLRIATGVQTIATMRTPASFIQFTDAIGLAILANERPYPADRFSNWTQDSNAIGSTATRLSDEQTFMFRTSDRYAVSLELAGLPSKSSAVNSGGYTPTEIADRLVYHLNNGGQCLVRTGDALGSTYAPCAIAPGTKARCTLTDRRLLEFTFAAQLINVNATPQRFSQSHQ